MNWESILGIITHPAVVTVLTAVAGVAIAGFARYRKLIQAIVKVVREVLEARDEDSPGGKAITEAEYAEIGAKVVAVVEKVTPLLKKGR